MPSYSEIRSMPGGGTMIVCGRRDRVGMTVPNTCGYTGCNEPAPLLCDYPLSGEPTCNAPMCRAHSNPMALGIDYCKAGGHPNP